MNGNDRADGRSTDIRMAALFFVAGAATAGVAVLFSPTPYRSELTAFALIALVGAGLIYVLPWHRWPHPVRAVIPALGILLMVVNAMTGIQGAATFAVFLLLILLWVGFSLGHWYGVPFALMGGVTYAVSYPAGSGPSGPVVEAVAVAGVSLIIATSIARWAHQIRESEARLRDAQEAANLGSWEWIPGSDTFRASGYFRRLFDDEGAPLVGTLDTFLDRVHPADREAARRELGLAVESGEPFRFDHRSIRSDGSTRVIETRGRVSQTGATGTQRVLGTTQDVTDLREADRQRRELEAERAARSSELRYRRFFEEDLTGDFVTTLDGVILECNAALAQFFGFDSPEELRGESVLQFYLDPGDRERAIRTVRERGKIVRDEQTFRRRDGKVVTAIINTIPDTDEEGELVGLRGYLFDITDRKQLEAQLRQAQRLEAVGRLAGGMAHDFNNVLAAIQGHVELILGEIPAESPIRDDLEVIRGSAERATSITRQLLAFSRRQVLQPRVLDLSRAVGEMTRIASRLLGTDIEVEVVPSLEPCRVRVDPGQIEQILMNLSTNARDAMPDGGRLSFRVSSGEITPTEAERHPYTVKPGPYAVLTVSDTGPGMAPEVRERIFEPFFTTKQPGVGTGLGLATVFGIVKQSKGYIWVDSESGAGTTFRIYFPLVSEPESEEPTATRLDQVQTSAGTILVVEDEPSVRSFVRRVLQRSGFHVLEAPNAEEALRAFQGRNGSVDLLLTDVVLPGMGGGQLAERLTREHPGLDVIFMSGHTEDDVVLRGIELAERRFLQKPFSHQALLEAVSGRG